MMRAKLSDRVSDKIEWFKKVYAMNYTSIFRKYTSSSQKKEKEKWINILSKVTKESSMRLVFHIAKKLKDTNSNFAFVPLEDGCGMFIVTSERLSQTVLQSLRAKIEN